MGGYGSGRWWRYGSRETTGDYLRLDVRKINRAGLLTAGRSYSWKWQSGDHVSKIDIRTELSRLILNYRKRNRGDEAWVARCQTVHITWTECNYGGSRPWFLCPDQGCGRRCAILYAGDIFACRKCFCLAYASQREQFHDRLARQLDKLRDRLGWEPGFFNGVGDRPKGMHWRTFYRLVAQHDDLVRSCLVYLHGQIGNL